MEGVVREVEHRRNVEIPPLRDLLPCFPFPCLCSLFTFSPFSFSTVTCSSTSILTRTSIFAPCFFKEKVHSELTCFLAFAASWSLHFHLRHLAPFAFPPSLCLDFSFASFPVPMDASLPCLPSVHIVSHFSLSSSHHLRKTRRNSTTLSYLRTEL